MKKFIAPAVVILILALSIYAFFSITNDKMSIKLAQKDTNLTNVLSNSKTVPPYKINVDEKFKYVTITMYSLGRDGSWNGISLPSNDIFLMGSSPQMLTFKSLKQDTVDICFPNDSGDVIFPKVDGEKELLEDNTLFKVAIQEEIKIVPDKEIPLLIYASLDEGKSKIKPLYIDQFYDTKDLLQYDVVRAVTLTFSENDNN